MKKEEYLIHVAVVEWLTLKYPKVMFRSDLAGIRLPLGLAIKAKKLNGGVKGWPDLFIAEKSGIYSGMYIEIKKDFDEVYKKNGVMRKNEHIQTQNEVLNQLNKRGYYAIFGLGFYKIVGEISFYLGK